MTYWRCASPDFPTRFCTWAHSAIGAVPACPSPRAISPVACDMSQEYKRPRSWQEMREQEIKWLIERTGDGLETWNARVLKQGFDDEPSLRAWLATQGVTGYP